MSPMFLLKLFSGKKRVECEHFGIPPCADQAYLISGVSHRNDEKPISTIDLSQMEMLVARVLAAVHRLYTAIDFAKLYSFNTSRLSSNARFDMAETYSDTFRQGPDGNHQ